MKKYNQNQVAQKKTVQAKVREGSPGGRSETTGVGFVKEVGFKPGVKERGSYRCTEWNLKRAEVMDEYEMWVWNGRTGARMRLFLLI